MSDIYARIVSLREQLKEVRASRIKLQNDAARFAETLVSVMEATGVFTQTDETSDEDVLKAAEAYVKVRKSVKDLKAPATKDNGKEVSGE